MPRMVELVGRLPRRLAGWIFHTATRVPAVRRRVEDDYAATLAGLDPVLKPYRDEMPAHTQLPRAGLDRRTILDQISELNRHEQPRWQRGFASGAVYHGNAGHIDFLNRVYALQSQSNPLHADLWPSTIRFEAEIVAMTAQMLGAGRTSDEICGTVTSGGTESILLAMKAYRDRAIAGGNDRPEMVLPVTAHAAFDKAAAYFGLAVTRIPVDDDGRADVASAAQAVGRRTAVLVGSAPSFPHGIVDPVEELSGLARERGIGFHTDACLGGFVLPWARELGYWVPEFDFRLPGVTSMSVDPHKYGYAAKGVSVVLYRDRELRRHQYFTASDWPGGLYSSPTLAGSRPGGLSAVCWAAMLAVGEQGYLDATRAILASANRIRRGIDAIDGLEVVGDPLWVIAFTATDLDIYRVMEEMTRRGWSLNGLQQPPAIHLAVTLRHTVAGVVERFLSDLAAAVEEVRTIPPGEKDAAPLYGTAAAFPARAAVDEMLERYIDRLYEL